MILLWWLYVLNSHFCTVNVNIFKSTTSIFFQISSLYLSNRSLLIIFITVVQSLEWVSSSLYTLINKIWPMDFCMYNDTKSRLKRGKVNDYLTCFPLHCMNVIKLQRLLHTHTHTHTHSVTGPLGLSRGGHLCQLT